MGYFQVPQISQIYTDFIFKNNDICKNSEVRGRFFIKIFNSFDNDRK